MTDVTEPTLIGSDRFGPYRWADPWPTYDRLRAEAPVWENPEGELILTRFADCEAVLRDPRFSSSVTHADPPRVLPEGDPRDLMDQGPPSLLFLDPPDHTRLRKLVSKAFTPRSVERLRPRVQELVDEILDDAAERGGLDVVADLGYELPVTVICELLGVPLDDRPQFAGWSHDAARLLDGELEPDVVNAGITAALRFWEYFEGLFVERRRQPQRRPGQPPDRGRGGGRPAQRAGAAHHGRAAVHRRPRDHHEPDRQRHLRPAAPPRPAGAAGAGTRRST